MTIVQLRGQKVNAMNRHERRAAMAQRRSAKLDPVTAVHESGHAVGRVLSAADMGFRPEEAIECISGPTPKAQATTFGPMLSRELQAVWDRMHAGIPKEKWNLKRLPEVIKQARAEGVDVHAWLRAKMLTTVFGPLAEAKFTNRAFKDVWQSPECEQDYKDAVCDGTWAGLGTTEICAEIEFARERATALIAKPNVWKAIIKLADQMPNKGRMHGARAAAIISAELEAATIAELRGEALLPPARIKHIDIKSIALMKDDPIRNPICMDCGVDTDASDEDYMVLDELWRTAHPTEAGRLCAGCLEARLGRRLRRADFPRYVLSAFDAAPVEMPVSDRLKDRLRLTHLRDGTDI